MTGPVEHGDATEPQWRPANDTERALANAVDADDRKGFFGIIGVAQLYLPQLDPTPEDTRSGPTFLTTNLYGRTFLPVFTSVEALVSQLGEAADGYTTTNYAELRRKWPDPEWRLTVNPGTPIDAYVTIEAVQQVATGEVEIPTAIEAILESMADEEAGSGRSAFPGDDGAELRGAAEGADAHRYLRALSDALVIMPIARQVEDAAALLEPDFPWRSVGDPRHPRIEVFTSIGSFTQAYPQGLPSVSLHMTFLLTLWPPGHDLSVDPGTPLAIDLTEDQLPTLLLYTEEDI